MGLSLGFSGIPHPSYLPESYMARWLVILVRMLGSVGRAGVSRKPLGRNSPPTRCRSLPRVYGRVRAWGGAFTPRAMLLLFRWTGSHMDFLCKLCLRESLHLQ
jgi:hypothetical protein